MLKLLRQKGVQKNIYAVLALGIAISFIVSGVLISHDDKNTLGALAMIDKHKITTQQYLDSYRAVQRQASFMYGDKFNEIKNRINFKGEAWDRLLLLDYAQKQKIRATDAEVVEWVSSQPAFKSKDKFDQKLYELYVERGLRATPRGFEEEIRQMLTIGKIQERIKSKPVDDNKLKELYQKEKTEKDLIYAILPWETQKDSVTVTDKDAEQLYSIVKNKLSTPERVKVSYLFIPKEKNVALKEIFEDKTQRMDPISKKYNLPLKETGYFSKNDAVPELGNSPEVLSECFKLAADEESHWIETDAGNYKMKLVDKKSEHPMSLEESREELKKIYTQQEATELAVKKLTRLKDKMKNTDFEVVLKSEGIETTSLEKYHTGIYPAGIYPSENLEQAVSSLKEGEISDAFEIPKGAMMVKVIKINPLDEKKFNEEKETFKKERSGKQFNDDMNQLLENLRKNLSLNLERMKEIFPSEETARPS